MNIRPDEAHVAAGKLAVFAIDFGVAHVARIEADTTAHLAETLLLRQVGCATDEDVDEAREAAASAKQAHEEARLMAAALPKTMAALRQAAAVVDQSEHLAMVEADRKRFRDALAALERDLRHLKPAEVHERGIAVRNLAQKVGLMREFREAVEDRMQHKAGGDVLMDLL